MARSISFSTETAKRLRERKGDGQTYEDVVLELLEQTADEDGEQLAPTADDELAHAAMTVSDVKKATQEQLAARDYIKQEYGVDSAQYNSEKALLAAVHDARNEGGDGHF